MSMTITLSLTYEEHVIIVEPGDDLIEMITNTLGNVDYYKFSINGENVTPINDLSKRLYNNIIINITPNTCGLANSLIGPRGCPLEIKSVKNSNRPTIKIETVHMSCSSDPFDQLKDMVGLIVYSFNDQSKFELNGHRCRTGYILIKLTDNIKHVHSNQGIVHGSLFKWFFGIEPDQRFVGGGFALQGGKTKFNSGVFNARNDDYHDGSKTMHQHEIHLIRYALESLYENHLWKKNPNISVNVIDKRYLNVWDFRPKSNFQT